MSDQPPGPPNEPEPPAPQQPATPPPPSGAPPPPPGGPPVRSGDRYDVMEAFRYGWDKFTDNLGPILGGVAVLFVGSLVVGLVWFGLVTFAARTLDSSSGALGFTATVLSVAGLLVYFALAFIVQAGIVRAGLAIVDGRRLELSTLLSTDRVGTVIVASLIVGLLTSIGSILFVLPGLIFAFFAQFFMFFVLDRHEGAWEAIMSSLRFTADNFVDVLLLYIGSAIVYTIGAILCGVGLIAAFPVVVIAQAYTFRVLRGEPVTA